MENSNGTEFIIIKHPLPITGNVFVLGIKFVEGIAVIKKNSKVHNLVRKSPIFKKHKELSLDWLQRFGFKSQDVKLIFGMDAYVEYMKLMAAKKELISIPTPPSDKVIDLIEESFTSDSTNIASIVEEHKLLSLCTATKSDGKVCKKRVSTDSQSKLYCFTHLKLEQVEEVKE